MRKIYIIESDEFKIIANGVDGLIKMCNTHLYKKLNEDDKMYYDRIDSKFRNKDKSYLKKFNKNNCVNYLDYNNDKLFKFDKKILREYFNCSDEIERKKLERKLNKKLSVDNQFLIKDTDKIYSKL